MLTWNTGLGWFCANSSNSFSQPGSSGALARDTGTLAISIGTSSTCASSSTSACYIELQVEMRRDGALVAGPVVISTTSGSSSISTIVQDPGTLGSGNYQGFSFSRVYTGNTCSNVHSAGFWNNPHSL